MMFFHENKTLIFGALAAVAIWLFIVFGLIRGNWAAQVQKQSETETNKSQWDAYYTSKPTEKMLPKPEAESAIADSNSKLQENLVQLKKIEFGTTQSLATYSEAAAGTGDKNNYFQSLRRTLGEKVEKTYNIKVPTELDLVARSDDPVSLNLMRLAMLDRFFLSCRDANIQRVLKITYDPATAIPIPEMPADPKNPKDVSFTHRDDAPPKKNSKTDAAPPPAAGFDKLVQFPIHVTVVGPERTVAQLLYEVQKPSVDNVHSYFCLNSVKVEINDTATGTVKATLGVSALLNEDTVNKLQIRLKTSDEERKASPNGRGTGDMERY